MPALVQGRSEAAISIARKAIARARLRSIPGVSKEDRIMNLAKVLLSTHPGSEHGQLLVRALQSGNGYRPADQMAVRWLVCRGQSPTVKAVSGFVQALAAKDLKDTERTDISSRVADTDGARAARFIADRIRETGEAPTWLDLVIGLGWPRNQRIYCKIIQRCERDGWIESGPAARSLRPGARYLKISLDSRYGQSQSRPDTGDRAGSDPELPG